MSWNPIGDAPANPYEIVEASSNYTIQNGELVFAESGVELTFPQPEPDGAIGVASVDGKPVDLVPQSGVIESEAERKYNKTEVSYFVSDGTDWYAVSNRELLNVIPDADLLHLDATEINANDGDTLSTWEDLSDSERNLSAIGNPIYVNSGIGGEPSVEFDGSNDGFEITDNVSSLSALSFYYVGFNNSTDDDGSPLVLRENHDIQFRYRDGFDEQRTGLNGTSDAGVPSLHTFTSTDGESAQLYREGNEEDSTTDVDLTDEFGLGDFVGKRDDDRYLDGQIAEIIMYEEDHDDETRNNIESHLMSKWGIE